MEDYGLGKKHRAGEKRILNKDGTFNLRKINGLSGFRDAFHFLIEMSFWKFLVFIVTSFVGVNVLFSVIYFNADADSINGLDHFSATHRFFQAFFFSCQTFTTVGYGTISPNSLAMGFVTSFEAFLGLLFFALSTGLLFGRFSKPNAKFLFSPEAVIAPYEDGWGLMIRFTNTRNNILSHAKARLILVYDEGDAKNPKRVFNSLDLEVSEITVFTTPWTLVHPITSGSPLFEKTPQDAATLNYEILVFTEAFDENYGQTVFARSSYKFNEIRFKSKFVFPYSVDEEGSTIVDLEKVNDTQQI